MEGFKPEKASIGVCRVGNAMFEKCKKVSSLEMPPFESELLDLGSPEKAGKPFFKITTRSRGDHHPFDSFPGTGPNSNCGD